MIDIALEGEIGTYTVNMPEAMKRVAVRMYEAVQENFRESGRPRWKPTKTGEIPFRGLAGSLFGSVKFTSGANWAEVNAGGGLPYPARAHQFGAVTHPNVTAKSRAYFWARYAETKDEKWKYMALSRKGKFDVRIPARPFMQLTPDDIADIVEILRTTAIVRTPTKTGERITRIGGNR